MMYKTCADTCFSKDQARLYFMTVPKARLGSVTVFYGRFSVRVRGLDQCKVQC